MQACIKKSLSSINVVKPVEVIIRQLELAPNCNADGSTILITGIENKSNQKIEMSLTPEFYLNVIKFDNEKVFLDYDSNSSNILTGSNQYKLVKIFLYGCIFNPLVLELDADLIHSSKENHTLIQNLMQNNFRNIRAMLFESFDDNGQILQQCTFFGSEYYEPLDPHSEILKIILGCKADINMKTSSGDSLLHFALNERNQVHQYLKREIPISGSDSRNIDRKLLHPTAKCIETLVKLQTNINAVNELKRTPFHLAVKYNDIESVKIILTRKPDLNRKCFIGQTALHEAVINRNVETVKMLLKEKVNVNIENSYFGAPLQATFYKFSVADNYDTNRKREQIIVALLNKGANPNVKDKFGQNLLSLAFKHDDLFTFKTLLKYNAEVNLKNKRGRNLLHDIVHLETLSNDYNVESRLEYAKILIENGADVNSVDKNGETPLHSAVKVYDAFPIIEFLLKNKARVNGKSNSGKTPLHYACRTKNLEIIKILINYKADMSVRDDKGRTPLHYVAWAGYQSSSDYREAELKSIIDLLMTKIDIDDKDEEGKTPLHIICDSYGITEYGYLIAYSFLKFGAFINTKDKYGKIPLYYAMTQNDNGLIKILLDGGADISENIGLSMKKIVTCIFFHEMIVYESYCNPTIVKHFIKAELVNNYTYKRDLDNIINDFRIYLGPIEEFRNSCVQELAEMKLVKIPHSEMSFYDFLMEKNHDMIDLADNDELMQYLSSDKLIYEFPIYAYTLRFRFIEVQQRSQLAQAQALTGASIFRELPDLCIHKVLGYLTKTELRRLINVTKSAVID